MAVRDDCTKAVPVAHMISSSESSEVLTMIVQCVSGVSRRYCMIDKSTAEMKALRQIDIIYFSVTFKWPRMWSVSSTQQPARSAVQQQQQNTCRSSQRPLYAITPAGAGMRWELKDSRCGRAAKVGQQDWLQLLHEASAVENLGFQHHDVLPVPLVLWRPGHIQKNGCAAIIFRCPAADMPLTARRIAEALVASYA